ncbi:uncharacterized protein BKCO1_3900084 [Diplodia corticola]|uniref:Uncharacterized protein n=1 Tax=Diplodia corticola TaxID=236234 RepID=A0A1J9QV23_9PEZI|nr:uncharacterized protein BKCO1_3900084 [Diplodia corticola]OJD32280.1 hypothetical protein BKCO1_3900084 [Diplodia corticola]
MRSFQTATRAGHAATVRRQALRVRAPRHARCQSTSSPTGPNSTGSAGSTGSTGSGGGGSGALTGAAAGAASALAVGYTWYHFSGAKSAVQTANQTRSYLQSGVDKVKSNTPEPNEAIKYLRDAASSYAAFVPGAKGYVDGAFEQLDRVREKHGDEVDRLVRDAWSELQDVAHKGSVSVESATKAWAVLQKYLTRVGKLAGEAAEDIVEQNPKLKEKLGGSFDQLNGLADKYGPAAKKQVDETWDQIRDLVSGGVGGDTPDKIKKLIEDTKKRLSKAGDEAWTKGLEQAKPYLDKNPKAKELLENNAEALKQGDVSELWETVKNNSDVEKLEEQVQRQVDKVKTKGMGGLEQYVNMVPGGSQMLPKLQLLQEVGQKRGKEAEQLLKETGDEIMQVLNKKSEKAKQLLDDAKKSSSR